MPAPCGRSQEDDAPTRALPGAPASGYAASWPLHRIRAGLSITRTATRLLDGTSRCGSGGTRILSGAQLGRCIQLVHRSPPAAQRPPPRPRIPHRCP